MEANTPVSSLLTVSSRQAQKVNEAKVQYLQSELEAKTKALLQLNRVSCGQCPAKDILRSSPLALFTKVMIFCSEVRHMHCCS